MDVTVIIRIANEVYQLFKKYQENQEQCQRLAECVDSLLKTLESLQRQDNLTMQLQGCLSHLQTTLQDAKDFMSKQESKNKMMKYAKTTKIQGKLQKFYETLRKQHEQLALLLQVELREAVNVANKKLDVVQEGVDAVQEGVDAVKEGVDAVQEGVDAVKEGVDAVQEDTTIIKKKLDRLLEDRQLPGAETSTPAQPAQKPDGLFPRCQQELKDKLSKRFHNVCVAIPKQGGAASLEEIYTELYITEGECKEVSTEHEVRQIEMSSKKKKEDPAIKYTDIFKPLPGQAKHIRTVMTKGVAGIGKTITVQKFILDWAKPDQEGAKPDEEGAKPDQEGAKQDIDFLFPVSFREINQMEEKVYTLIEFIHHFFGEPSDLIFSTDEKYKITFIFDGLDESRLPLDFQNNKCIYNVTERATVDVLLTNLIKGNLLPSAHIWITSRPAAANQIPAKCVDQVTEVRGFTDQQKEEYFQKNINKQEMVSKIIRHLKRSRSLYIMCHIPVFCWMAATVLVSILTRGKSDEIPASLTQMYIHFLITQVKYISQKYKDIWNQETILSLGRLAFQQLEKGNLIFYEKDLMECGMDAKEASDYSGICTQILREDESGLYQERVFSFVHLSIQEFLAALYVFICNRDRNMSDQQQTSELSVLFRAATLHDLHKTAVDLALQSKNGHLDLFLRFLLGLSLESNQKHLQDLLLQNSSQSQNSVDTVQYVKKKIRGQRHSIRGERSSDRRINLFYCLNELNQHAVVEHIGGKEGKLSVEMLLPGEWRTVKFQLMMSEEHLDGFDLQKYIQTPEKDQTDLLSPDDVLQKLVPVVTTSTEAKLESCKLTDKSCLHLASVLSSPSSRLTELHLGCNDLHDSGVELLCSELQHQHCRLENLGLRDCKLTDKSCLHLVSVLSSHLTKLDLSHNALHDSGVELLCSELQHQHCRLEKLGLQNCKLTDKSCLHLVSVLSSPSSRLTWLDLSINALHDSGVELLCSGLQHQHCRLEKLLLVSCKLTGKDCRLLASALSSPSSRIKELILLSNGLRASDVEQLRALKEDPNCRLGRLMWEDLLQLRSSSEEP